MPLSAALLAALPGILSAGSSLINSGLSRRNSRRNVDRTIAGNLELSQYEFSQNLAQWERQNAYNTPAAQMQRYKDAGLNPNLIYGQGTPGNAASSPQYDKPTVDYTGITPIQIPNIISEFQNVGLKDAQIKNVEQQTKLGGAVTQIKEIQALINSKTIQSDTRLQLKKLEKSIIDIAVSESKDALLKKMLEKSTHDISKAEQDDIYKKLRNVWMGMGATSSDSPIFRIMLQLMSKAGINPAELIGENTPFKKGKSKKTFQEFFENR